jgi:Uri superfamily endonuclease
MSIFDKVVNGKIYMLCSDLSDKIYIGSTTVSLEERLERHITGYDDWLTSNFKTAYLSSFEILKYGEYRMELLEDCPEIIGWDLLKREQYHLVVNYKDTVNIIIPGKDMKCYLSDTSDIYTCSCGSKMLNDYKVRRKHSLSIVHRKLIRELHTANIINSGFELIEVEEKPVFIDYETGRITLTITY